MGIFGVGVDTAPAESPRSLLLDWVEEVLAVPGVRREPGWPLPLF